MFFFGTFMKVETSQTLIYVPGRSKKEHVTVPYSISGK